MVTNSLTQDRLKQLLNYDPATGIFTYACARPKVRVGAVAGHTHAGHGYRQIKLDGKLYLAHRLAWLYVYGEWPGEILDHINRDRTDNRIANLRQSDKYLNRQNAKVQCNSSTGVKGVGWNRVLQKWHARISIGGRRLHIGWFHTKEDAIAARKQSEMQLHPHRLVA